MEDYKEFNSNSSQGRGGFDRPVWNVLLGVAMVVLFWWTCWWSCETEYSSNN